MYDNLWNYFGQDHSDYSGEDQHITPGSFEAKKLWAKADAEAHSQESIAKAKAIHPKAVGFYKGKALVPGESGYNQGDFEFLRDKLVYERGYSPEVATKIAARLKYIKYGSY